MSVRCDLEIMAKDGDGALWVQIDAVAPTTFRFTIEQAAEAGMPAHLALREMAQFILDRVKKT